MWLDERPFGRGLLLAVVLVTALFVALGPESSRGLSATGAAVYWLLHIGSGVACCVLGAIALNRCSWIRRRPPWQALLASGLLGSALFAPIAVVLEQLLGVPDAAPDGLLDRMEDSGGAVGALAEWLQLVPEFVAAWLLLNAPPLLRIRADREAPPAGGTEPISGTGGASAAVPATTVRTGPDTGAASAASAFLARLPPALGSDLVSVSADLHYLHVRTTRGRGTVLGSIAEAEQALGPAWLRIHRSHLVATGHVRRVARKGASLVVETSDGQRLPVSRRRAGAIKERLGTGFVVDEPVPD